MWRTFRWLLLAFGLGLPGVAFANAGIPMISLTLPFMAIALVPIIALELIGLRWLLGVPAMKAAQVSTVANLASTLVGTPLAWLCYLALGFIVGIPMGALDLPGGLIAEVTLFSAWLPPDEGNLGWMIPAATAVLLIGYLFVSVWLERKVARRMLADLAAAQVDKAIWRVNLFSYGLLELLALCALAYALLVRAGLI